MKKRVRTAVLNGVVARSARRFAAFDVGGFVAASSEDITPLRHAVRASSPNVVTQVFDRNGRGFSPHVLGAYSAARVWGERLRREAAVVRRLPPPSGRVAYVKNHVSLLVC